ncbi:MAG: BamA/TamA family outer membrane protein [Bacteroidales bacterium]|nr:BamA/TamA family outer membrane protein [Bacteroidales bacterium]
MKRSNYIYVALLAMLSLVSVSCSTTSRLGANDVLYTGVKKLNYQENNNAKIDAAVQDQIFEAINVKPNNPLYSPYYRTPFPIGLWVYNHWDPNSTGIKGWLYKKLVAQPVLVSRVRPETRVDMINTLLHNNGYFSSSASYQLNYSSKNNKKASITYDVKVNEPYRLGELKYLNMGTPVSEIIDSVAKASTYFQTGSRYCLDSLNAVRIEITNVLRNKGYYYFKPEYIEYLADSVTTKGVINMQIIKSGNVPNMALIKFLSNKVYVTVQNSKEFTVRTDTLEFRRCTLYKRVPVNIKDDLIPSCIRSRHGRPFRVDNMDRTQLYLSRLGIFSSIDMKVANTDSLTADGDGLLDVHITCTLDDPIEATLEAQGTSKSNSFIGPGFQVGLSHKNYWGGAERLSAKLRGSYEWQTGSSKSDHAVDINSYELGLDLNFDIPRLIAPKIVKRSSRYVNWTKFSLNADFMNRPNYFKMIQFGGDMSWEWHPNQKSTHQLIPFRLRYNRLLSHTAAFDSAMIYNPALAQSFKNVFIPEIQYTYTYDNHFGPNNITWTSTISEAGSIFSGIWAMCGAKGEKKLFGTPFSQFVRAQTQLVWNRKIGSMNLVSRFLIGAAHAFGNSTEVPYSAQFYIGGANSIRAFPVRSIGPGRYVPKEMTTKSYYDQTGTFKFETNWELRFPILGYLKGAMFLDMGNVWLLKDDEYRPGGQISLKHFFNDIAVGTGLGIRFDMEMLVLRADLGLGIHAPYDTGKSGYFNIPRFKDCLGFHLAIGYPF